MLQAFIDESCTDGVVFVMAGYIATAEQWSAFSADWATLLRLRAPFRRITEFHMVEMNDSQVAMEQSELFYRLVEAHLKVHVSCSIRIADLRAAFDGITWPDWLDNLGVLTSEHFSAFEAIVKGLAIHQSALGISGPIDVYFDEHSSKEKCLNGWDLLKRYGHPAIVPMLGSRPVFKDSATTMPLQAADMLAYWVRKSQPIAGSDYQDFNVKFPWERKSKDMRGVHVFYTREMIERNFRNVLLSLLLTKAGVSSALAGGIASPARRLLPS